MRPDFMLRARLGAIALLTLALGGPGCAADGDVLREGTATTGTADDACTGLSSNECAMQPECAAVYGSPYTLGPNQSWCVASNGLEYLGCHEAIDCSQTIETICSSGNDATYRIQYDCIPADLDANVCEPPVSDAPFC
jgi:hypothetical protein